MSPILTCFIAVSLPVFCQRVAGSEKAFKSLESRALSDLPLRARKISKTTPCKVASGRRHAPRPHAPSPHAPSPFDMSGKSMAFFY
jgi:hypothetical protein